MSIGSNQFDDFNQPSQAPPRAGSSFSLGRVFLLLGFLVLMGLPRAWREFCDQRDKQKQEEVQQQAKMDRDLNEMISKVRDGKVQAGPAFKRLFQIEEPAKDGAVKNGSAQDGAVNGDGEK